MAITSNDQGLIVTPDAAADEGSYGDNTVYYLDLAGSNPSNWQRRPLVETFHAGYSVGYFILNYTSKIFADFKSFCVVLSFTVSYRYQWYFLLPH